LKFTHEILKDHQIKLILEVESSQLADYRIRAVRRISSKGKIAGFRPGKAPLDVVKRIYGEQNLEEEVYDLLVHDLYPKLIDESKIKPSGPGRLEEIIRSDPPKFVFIVPLEPEVRLGDYKKIRKKYSPEKISSDDVTKVIKKLQLNFSTAETANREIQKGDLVDFLLNAKLLNPSIDENPEVIKESPQQIIVGEFDKDKDDFPFKGFDETLIGLKINEEKQIEHNYPKNSEYENLQGKSVGFSIKIQGIRSLKKPEINDEFAKNLGGYENLTGLKKSISEELQQAKDKEYDEKFYQELIDKIIDISTIKYPPTLVSDESERILQNFEHSLEKQNLDLVTYLKINNMDREKFIDEIIKPAAIHQLKQSLVLEEIQKQEKIEIVKDELQEEFSLSLNKIQSTQDYQHLRRQFTLKGLENRVLFQTASRLINEKVELRLKEIVTAKKSIKANNKSPEANHEISSDKSKKQLKEAS